MFPLCSWLSLFGLVPILFISSHLFLVISYPPHLSAPRYLLYLVLAHSGLPCLDLLMLTLASCVSWMLLKPVCLSWTSPRSVFLTVADRDNWLLLTFFLRVHNDCEMYCLLWYNVYYVFVFVSGEAEMCEWSVSADRLFCSCVLP